ncbi:MAG: hypothetical protein AAF499_13815 [Pseudomonadota bacterium]
MFDVNSCYWVVDGHGRVNLANAPCQRAPLCVPIGIQTDPAPPTPLTPGQALALQQAAADSQQRSLTFLHSHEGLALIRKMFSEEAIRH